MLVGALAIVVILALLVAPQLWVRGVMSRHAAHDATIPWTGAAFARHVLDGMGLNTVLVEETGIGDHYHPIEKAVRLTPANFNGRSLTAMVVAAHEVGHAMQDATGYAPLATRTRFAGMASRVHIAGLFVLGGTALIASATRPAVLLIGAVTAGIMNLTGAMLHVVTLPVEYDASFNRALILLKEGRFIPPERLGAARHILAAAAYTYVAQALVSLFRLRVLKV